MEEARCRALFLALFAPMLTTPGNVPRLRARSAHFVCHLPAGRAGAALGKTLVASASPALCAARADAVAAVTQSLKDLPPWFEVTTSYLAHDHYESKGRDAKQAVPTQRWHCQFTLSLNQQRASAGRTASSLCALSQPTSWRRRALSDEELVGSYKQQGSVERGFRFLKDPLFLASSVFVKKPERIVALGFIMVLCLLVYRFVESRLRTQLNRTGQTLPESARASRRPRRRCGSRVPMF
jgi:hypothetical protein